MATFQCEHCGCRDNSATGLYHNQHQTHLFDWTGIEHRKGKKLCCVCAPQRYSAGGDTRYGKWHNRFPRFFLPHGQFVTASNGNLHHIELGKVDLTDFLITPLDERKVDQAILGKENGSCMQAAMATLLDVPTESVPHFRAYGDNWYPVFSRFMLTHGWDPTGSGYPHKGRPSHKDCINGYLFAVVPSLTYENVSHAVVMDVNGVVRHDPNPNKRYEGVNVIDSGQLECWALWDWIGDDPDYDTSWETFENWHRENGAWLGSPTMIVK